MNTQVPMDKAKAAILAPVIAMLVGPPQWIAKALSVMQRVLAAHAESIPHEAELDRKKLADLKRQIDNLVDNLLQTKVQSTSLTTRLTKLEDEAGKLE